MFKKVTHRLALSLALTLLAAPLSRIYAQSPDLPMPNDVVTGGDPEPTGEPPTEAVPAPFLPPPPALSQTPVMSVVTLAWLE